eukprot:1318708-Pyramimonas_sp.AAC.1
MRMMSGRWLPSSARRSSCRRRPFWAMHSRMPPDAGNARPPGGASASVAVAERRSQRFRFFNAA